MTREFSQSCNRSITEHPLVPGMSQYGESQEFSNAGTAAEYTGGVSFPTLAAHNAELSQSLDQDLESTDSNEDFSPAIKRA